MQAPFLFHALGLALLGGCGRYWVCELEDPDRTAALPQRLSETGLYTDLATEQLAPDVFAYTPQFPLWSDGADKQRWIQLPPGSQIDTSDPDEWRFPDGTRLWKEFAASGVKIETRLLEKRGPRDADWIPISYVWNADDSEAIAAPLGDIDARATGHDVPAAGECLACHGGRQSFVLGFSAIQLAAPAAPGDLDLAGLVDQGRLTNPPTAPPVVPGDATVAAALGYLHANCGHCHNQTRPAHDGARCFDPQNDLDFSLSVGALATPADTATYRTVVGKDIEPGDPGASKVVVLMSRRGFLRQMPPLATTRVDDEGVAMLRRWIEGLP